MNSLASSAPWKHGGTICLAPNTQSPSSLHKNLTYFRTAQKLNCQQAWWSLLLSQFDLKLVHIPESQMVQSNVPSWWPDLAPEGDNDNANLTLLPNTLFIKVINTDLKNAFLEAFTKNDSMHKTVEAISGSGTPLIRSAAADWKIEEGLVFYKGRCFVPENFNIWQRVMEMHNDTLPMGHPGQWQTLELIQWNYWWPGIIHPPLRPWPQSNLKENTPLV